MAFVGLFPPPERLSDQLGLRTGGATAHRAGAPRLNQKDVEGQAVEKWRDTKYLMSSPTWDSHIKADYESRLHRFFRTSKNYEPPLEYITLDDDFSINEDEEEDEEEWPETPWWPGLQAAIAASLAGPPPPPQSDAPVIDSN